MKRTIWRRGLLAALLLVWASPALAQPAPTSQPTSQPAAGPIDHTPWNTLVSTYVSDGVVNYTGLKANAEHMALLDAYVASLATADPSSWSREEQLAFWLNAYNALVVDAVLDNWPVDSVLNVDGFFDRTQYRVAGEPMNLNQLEDSKIRPVFEEPRIHFALVCAAAGCPPLRSEAYNAANLEAQLDEQTRFYIRASTRLEPENRAIYCSKIFEWFNRDFQPSGGHRAFIARYVHDSDRGTVVATVNFFHFEEYDWAINGH